MTSPPSDWTPNPAFAIHSPRLVLSHLLPDNDTHCQCMVEIQSTSAYIAAFGKSGVDTIEKARAMINGRIKTIHSLHGYGHYLVSAKTESGPRPVGIVSLVKSRPEHAPDTALPYPDIGYGFLEAEMGKGYAAEASSALIEYARANLGVKTVLGITKPMNLRSQRVMEKIGLERKGNVVLKAFPKETNLIFATPGLTDDMTSWCVETQEGANAANALEESRGTA